MTIVWHLRGYDRASERLGVEFDISPETLPIVRGALPEPDNDPDMIDPVELTRDQTVGLATTLGLSIDPDRFDYFIEADEDWGMVEAKRDWLSAAA